MDRNSTYVTRLPRAQVVALRKESVDRNLLLAVGVMLGALSLSARRAWIEISCIDSVSHQHLSSLSARRAWIEISIAPGTSVFRGVALRKESVDRNKL